MIVAICGSKFIQCVKLIVAKTGFGYQNYMGEVSRLLIASPRLRLMECLFLIFSHPVGIDAPYFCLFSLYIIISFSIIILWMAVTVLCRHWGGHLY